MSTVIPAMGLLLPQCVPLHDMELVPEADQFFPQEALPILQVGDIRPDGPQKLKNEIFGLFSHFHNLSSIILAEKV
jgi:hypothetical protein